MHFTITADADDGTLRQAKFAVEDDDLDAAKEEVLAFMEAAYYGETDPQAALDDDAPEEA